jgi:hypothetical protein
MISGFLMMSSRNIKMSISKSICILSLLTLLMGCGHTLEQTLQVRHNPLVYNSPKNTIAILPFADYSHGDDVNTSFYRNMAVIDSVTDKLEEKGYRVPVQEDVFSWMVEQDLIKVVNYDKYNKKDSNRKSSKLKQSENPLQAPGTHGLDKESLAAISSYFKVDYILRGRIIKYNIGQENTWSPMRKGIMPIFFSGSNRVMLGSTKTDTYDTINDLVLGYALGHAIGSSLDFPLDRFDADNYKTVNGLIGGSVGASLLANNFGNPPQAIVYLRIWIQDPKSGDVIWTNWAKVAVAPKSIFSNSEIDNLFESALDQAVSGIINDFSQAMEM